MDLFVTSNDANISGIYREAGTYNEASYYKHESAEYYIYYSDGSYTLASGLGDSYMPLYYSPTGTPLGNWTLAMGTSGCEPVVTEYVATTGTITGFTVSGTSSTINVDGTYTLTDLDSGYSADSRVFSNGTYYLARFTDVGGWYFATTYNNSFDNTFYCKAYDANNIPANDQAAAAATAEPSDVAYWWDLEVFTSKTYSVTPIYGEDGGNGEAGDDSGGGDSGLTGTIKLTVSGIDGTGSPNLVWGSWMNGDYYLVDSTATGKDRVWQHENPDYTSQIRYKDNQWILTNNSTSTGYSIYISTLSLENPYNEDYSSYSWMREGNSAPNISVVASVVSGDSGGGNDSDGDTGGDTTVTVPDAAPVVGDKGIMLGDVYIPNCPNPADNHLSKVSATGKNIAIDWVTADFDLNSAVSVNPGVTYQAKTAGWLVASGAGSYGGLVLAMGPTADTPAFQVQGWCMFVPRGWYYLISQSYTSFDGAYFMSCKGATE